MTGTVVRLNPRGFGFIQDDDSHETIYFHASSLTGDLEFGEQLLERRVEFNVIGTAKGPRAVEMRAAR